MTKVRKKRAPKPKPRLQRQEVTIPKGSTRTKRRQKQSLKREELLEEHSLLLDDLNLLVEMVEDSPLPAIPGVGAIFQGVKTAVKTYNKVAPKFKLPTIPDVLRKIGKWLKW